MAKVFFIGLNKIPSWIPEPSFIRILYHIFKFHHHIALITFEKKLLVFIFLFLISVCFFIIFYKLIFSSLKNWRNWRIFFQFSFSTKLLFLWISIYIILFLKSIFGESVLLMRALIFIAPAIYLLEARFICRVLHKLGNRKFFFANNFSIFFCWNISILLF